SGGWRALAETAPQHGLPNPQPAPDTHYDWQWTPSGLAPASDHGDFSLPAACAAMADALQQAGFTFSPQAARILLPLDPAPLPMLAMAGLLLEALADPARRPLFVITRAAWALHDGERVQPVQRAAWGLLRVAAIEQPERQIVAIDLAADADWEALPAAVAAASGSRWIAMRDGRALFPRLAQQTHMAPALPAGSL
ncbi:MAG: SpnB-like Rossmann fold domain-containing protein, partial [Microvirgula sp.]